MKIINENIHWLLRLTLSTTFLIHGFEKIRDCSGLITMGLPKLIAYFVGPFEFFGAIFILIGGLVNNSEIFATITRIGATLISIIMLGAIFFVHIGEGWKGIEYQVLILSVCILFIFKGNDA